MLVKAGQCVPMLYGLQIKTTENPRLLKWTEMNSGQKKRSFLSVCFVRPSVRSLARSVPFSSEKSNAVFFIIHIWYDFHIHTSLHLGLPDCGHRTKGDKIKWRNNLMIKNENKMRQPTMRNMNERRKKKLQRNAKAKKGKNLTINSCESKASKWDIWKFLADGGSSNLYDMKNEAVIFLCLRFLRFVSKALCASKGNLPAIQAVESLPTSMYVCQWVCVLVCKRNIF